MGCPRANVHITVRTEYLSAITQLLKGTLKSNCILADNGEVFQLESAGGFTEITEEDAAYGEGDLPELLSKLNIPFDAACYGDMDLDAYTSYGRVGEDGMFHITVISEDAESISLEEAYELSTTEKGRAELKERYEESLFTGPPLEDTELPAA